MLNTITKVHPALYLSEICDTEDIKSLGSIWGGRYDYIFLLMNDKDNIRHYIVAREVSVTIATTNLA